jgi:hypothetical protein
MQPLIKPLKGTRHETLPLCKMVCVPANDNSSTYASLKIDTYAFDLFRIAKAETMRRCRHDHQNRFTKLDTEVQIMFRGANGDDNPTLASACNEEPCQIEDQNHVKSSSCTCVTSRAN